MRFQCFCCLCITFITVISLPAQSQVKKYLMYAKEKEVGSLTISRTEKQGKVIYESKNLTSIRFLKQFDIDHRITSIYQGGKLLESEVIVYLNGSLHEHARTTWEGSHYRVWRMKNKEELIEESIPLSSVSLYFKEPSQAGKVYSEQYGTFHDLSEEEEGVYRMDKSWGRENLYYYEQGDLVRAKFGTGVVTTYLERID